MMINIREVSRRTGRTVRTVRWWINSGKLPATKGTKEWLIDEKDLERKGEHGYSNSEYSERAETA